MPHLFVTNGPIIYSNTIHIPCMIPQDSILFFNSFAFSFYSDFIEICNFEKFRVQGAPGGYTFYVGSRSNFAYNLFMVSNTITNFF